jgi:uncharacterized membrane protein YcaP (DUF421 family)
MNLNPGALIAALPIYGWVVFSSIVIYLFLILGFRFVGRRQLGQLTVIDLVVIVVMGSAVETAMIHGDVGLGSGIVCAATLLATNRIIALLVHKSRRFRRFVSGGPVLLVHYGKVVEGHLRRAGMTEADLIAAIRERGYSGPEDVKFAIMEEDGEINVIKNDATTHKVDDVAASPSRT